MSHLCTTWSPSETFGHTYVLALGLSVPSSSGANDSYARCAFVILLPRSLQVPWCSPEPQGEGGGNMSRHRDQAEAHGSISASETLHNRSYSSQRYTAPHFASLQALYPPRHGQG